MFRPPNHVKIVEEEGLSRKIYIYIYINLGGKKFLVITSTKHQLDLFIVEQKYVQ